PRLEFIGEGRMSGYTGCNMFSGDWSMQGATVVVGRMAMTKRLCMGPVRDVEKRFIAAMQEGSRGTRTGHKLASVAPGDERFESRAADAGGLTPRRGASPPPRASGAPSRTRATGRP